jgi:hypothetical protein
MTALGRLHPAPCHISRQGRSTAQKQGTSERSLMSKRLIKLIVALELLGFILVMMVIWADEYFDLPRRLFNAAPTPMRVEEGLFESFMILLLAVMVVIFTLLMFVRIRELESFILVCAWCKKVKVDNSWTSFERYLEDHKGTKSSHGICPTCYEQFKSDQKEYKNMS